MIELHGEDSDSDKEDGAEESDSKHQTTKKASGSESKNHEGNIDELDPAEDESDESSGGSSVDLRLYMVNRGRITQSDDSKSNVPEKEDKTTQSNETKPDLPGKKKKGGQEAGKARQLMYYFIFNELIGPSYYRRTAYLLQYPYPKATMFCNLCVVCLTLRGS
ncbi:hypothetical protein PCANC_07486 [Puccinia coronata f. sp. avenae]|uniref:Uncharacterized protein n=1 Tax=Puccinia coronata f. sp. avenae TaxID=200324 RepID=A0A2N5VTC8_9BASI|nr:hypothetical protein PCANC_07486 [Puccinia coronata f. sp. avenae]